MSSYQPTYSLQNINHEAHHAFKNMHQYPAYECVVRYSASSLTVPPCKVPKVYTAMMSPPSPASTIILQTCPLSKSTARKKSDYDKHIL